MGMIDRLSDAVVKKFSGRDTVRVEPNQLAQIVYEEFIGKYNNADLEQLLKVVERPGFFGKKITSLDGRFDFVVGGFSGDLIRGIRRMVYVFDSQQQRFYQINDNKWSSFKKIIVPMVKNRIIEGRNTMFNFESTITEDTHEDTYNTNANTENTLPLFCSSCGKKYDDDALFCVACGKPRK